MSSVARQFKDKRLGEIAGRVDGGGRLGTREALALFETDDLPGLGRLADQANRARNGDRVYYINNVHLNYTNICVNSCRFCAYNRKNALEPGAFFLSVEQVLAKARAGWREGVREFHIVGGCHPDAPLEYYEEMLSALAGEYPGVHLQAFTAVEVEHLAAKAGLTVAETLTRLKACGLGSLPGGGGEIFNPAVRNKICPKKISGERFLEVMRTAHSLGIPTNVTMLFGHVESRADRVDHLLGVRALQDETGGFNSFIPLLFHPENTEFGHISKTGGLEALKTFAVSRLVLDNFDHIKAFWIMLGLPLTQMALFFGADDVNGTVHEEKITHEAGAGTPQYLPAGKLVRLIREAGRTPVERDTLYRPVSVDGRRRETR
ncbi:MAG: aminofutalosine synthase MqnE [Candidatus Glassbacteria bacterium]|nr:aminofutalosine synthase MqnE [Candidatus Glassbacteria bacterium]